MSTTKNIFLLHLLFIGLLALAACHQNPKTEENAVASPSTTDTMVIKTDINKSKFTVSMVDNKKDPNCGMPVTAGIADTVHYNGKVYGFCSEECKDAFLKNPVALAKAAELK